MVHQTSRTRSFRLGTLGFVCALALSVLTATPASGFGTPNGLLGQHAEHERITRAALACPPNTQSDGHCFEPDSLDQLAGRTGTAGGLTPWLAPWGAVGAPDVPGGGEFLGKPAAHCDDADFLKGHYPVTRKAATARLQQCVDHLRNRFKQGVTASARLLDSGARVKPDEVKITRPGAGVKADCPFNMKLGRAKCDALEGLGRALHGAQDFYAHSNWTDVADKSKPIGPTNPPGLNRPGPSPVLDLRGTGKIKLPSRDLSTGCFSKIDRSPGILGCKGRVTHATLNKDKGIINSVTGATSGPTTSRGKVGANFAKAVKGAIVETRRQWKDFRAELVKHYGQERASFMICALTHDDAVLCTEDTWTGTITGKVTNAPSHPGSAFVETWTAHVTLVRDRHNEPVRAELNYKVQQGTISYEMSGSIDGCTASGSSGPLPLEPDFSLETISFRPFDYVMWGGGGEHSLDFVGYPITLTCNDGTTRQVKGPAQHLWFNTGPEVTVPPVITLVGSFTTTLTGSPGSDIGTWTWALTRSGGGSSPCC